MYSDILANNPYTNEIIKVPDVIGKGDLSNLKKRIKGNNYDLIIDLHNNIRTFYLKRFLFNPKIISFKKYSIRKFLLVKFKINYLKGLPSILYRYLGTLEKINISVNNENNQKLLPEIYTNDSSKVAVDSLIKYYAGKKLICIIPSSRHFTKTYPPELFAELIKNYDESKYVFLLIGKGNDKDNIDKIKTLTGNNVINLCDKMNLLMLTELFRKCSLVFTGDTGPMHIAESVNAPIVLLAGSSVKEFGFYPVSNNVIIHESNDLKCRPCSHIGLSSCPENHFKCMRDISPNLIYNESLSLLNKN
jgi:ADP-heptose:LPS heptosyltransferase